MPTVALIGAGLIGRSWANVFARGGWDVRITDTHGPTLDTAPGLIEASLLDLEAHGLVANAKAAAQRVTPVRSIADALKGARFVQESGPELLDAKIALFKELDASTGPDVILASSTSAIVASKFTESLTGRARCLVAHPVNPPHLVPVVELCGAPWTSADTIARARKVFDDLAMRPIEVRKEVDGFVLNRLQAALLAEAFRLVEDGVVSPQDLDSTVADGLGLRWAFMGPFETIELNAPEGIADYCRRYGPFFTRVASDPAPATVWDPVNWQKAVDAWGPAPSTEVVLRKSEWRNSRLAALLAHKKQQPNSSS
jgi:L-gulonate 3-dehydrogenase